MRRNGPSLLMAAILTGALSLLAARPCVASDPDPTPTDLGILPGYQVCAPKALNARAQIVGECQWYPALANPDIHIDQPVTMPFVWEYGAMSALPLPSGFSSGTAAGINASGQVVGSCWNWYWYGTQWDDYGWEMTGTQACLWQRGAGGWSVTLLGAPSAKNASGALLINDAGRIYAETWSTSTYAHGSAVLDNGVWTELKDAYGDLEPVWWGRPQMNQNGQVLAWSSIGGGLVLWTNGTAAHIVPNLYWGPTLDNAGRVAGMYMPDGADPFTAFLYQPGAQQPLQTLPCSTGVPGDPVLWLGGMNDSGQLLFNVQASGGADLLIGGPTLNDAKTTIFHLPNIIMYYNQPLLNASGELCGTLDYNYGGAWYARVGGAAVEPLNSLPGGSCAMVVAMNDSGVVLGTSVAPDYTCHAVMWAPNHSPTAEAGPDQTMVATGVKTYVTLDGSLSADPDNDALTYSWSENGLQIATGATPTVQLGAGVHTITLTVTDPYGATGTDTVTISISALAVSNAVLVRNGPIYAITVALMNRTNVTANGVRVTGARLDGANTITSLPMDVDPIRPGGSRQVKLLFKAVQPDANGQAVLTISGRCSLGAFFTTQLVKVN